jgi:rhamnogalacturonyl hydrolase YesR
MKYRVRIILVLSSLIISTFNRPLQAQDLDSLVNHSLDFAKQQLVNTVAEVNNSALFPRSTLEDGSWKVKDSGSWTSGFFPGCLWYMYEWSEDTLFLEWAENWTVSMEQEKFDTGSHDVGFKIYCSFGNGYRITGNESYPAIMIKAAQSLATRFNPTVGCIKSWDNPSRGQYPVIIDNMMNLELLFWASKNGSESSLYDIAVTHSVKTIENHVREDGSTYHVVDFDPSTGEVISRKTVQGYSDESTWARGQAWGLYGFTMAYRETDSTLFLATAEKIADYFVDNLPEDKVPYWDFDAPNIPDEEKDASAAAIAASGLLELSVLVSVPEKKIKYQNAASDILESLCSVTYLAEGTNSSGILLHGVGNNNSGSEVDVSLIYADHYFIEALIRYLQLTPATIAMDNRSTAIPITVQLLQNYPNPFNNATTIEYQLAKSGNIWLGIYSLTGRLIEELITGFQNKGKQRIFFQPDALASGTYFIVLKAADAIQIRKMILIK